MGFQFGTKKKEEPIVEEEPKKADSSEANKEDWMTRKWRPAMAMMYMICCLADFAIFPLCLQLCNFGKLKQPMTHLDSGYLLHCKVVVCFT